MPQYAKNSGVSIGTINSGRYCCLCLNTQRTADFLLEQLIVGDIVVYASIRKEQQILYWNN